MPAEIESRVTNEESSISQTQWALPTTDGMAGTDLFDDLNQYDIDALTGFVEATPQQTETGQPRQYDIFYDVEAFNQIKELAKTDPITAEKEKQVLFQLIESNILTTGRERYNVPLSRNQYKIVNGRIVHPQFPKEPFLDVVKRGAEACKNGIDDARLAAEVAGFAKIESVFADPTTPDGTAVLLLSPHGESGSQFRKDFADFMIKRGDTIDYVRLTINGSRPDLVQKANWLSGGQNYPIEATDADFLSRPLAFYPGHNETPVTSMVWSKTTQQYEKRISYHFSEERAKALFGVSGGISEQQFTTFAEPRLTEGVKWYKAAATKIPPDVRGMMEAFNYTLNRTDEAVFGPSVVKNSEAMSDAQTWSEESQFASEQDRFFYYAHKAVRSIQAGCGASMGYDLDQPSSQMPDAYGLTTFQMYSAIDGLNPFNLFQITPEWARDEGYGVDRYGTRKITCKECDCSYARPAGDKIPACILPLASDDKRVQSGQRKTGEICGNKTGISC